MSNPNYPTPTWDAVLASTYGMSVRFDGKYVDGTPGADTIIDYQFAEEREVQGGDVSAWSGAPGDRVTMGVYSPIDPSTGQPVDPPIEVKRIATDIALPASKVYTVKVGYSMKMQAGLIFRITYTSVGASAPQIAINMITWIQEA